MIIGKPNIKLCVRESNVATSTNVAMDKFGPPGMPGDFVVLDMFRSETRSDRERQRDSTRENLR